MPDKSDLSANRNKMMTVPLVLIVMGEVTGICTPALAQARLGLRDAMKIVQHLPEIQRARRAGQCPRLEAASFGAQVAMLSASIACNNPSESNVLAHYNVDLSTGVVRSGITDELHPDHDSEAVVLARGEVLRAAAARALSPNEAACLMKWSPPFLEAKAKGLCPELPGGAKDFRFFILDYPFTLTGGCEGTGTPRPLGRFFVDRQTGLVVDQRTEEVIESAELGLLRRYLMGMRRLPELTTEEARVLAENAPPVVTARESKLCPVLIEEAPQWAEEMFFAMRYACSKKQPNYPDEGLRVNTFNGEVIDPDSLHVYDSPVLRNLREQFLTAARKRREFMADKAKELCSRD